MGLSFIQLLDLWLNDWTIVAMGSMIPPSNFSNGVARRFPIIVIKCQNLKRISIRLSLRDGKSTVPRQDMHFNLSRRPELHLIFRVRNILILFYAQISWGLRGGSTLQWENRAYFSEMNCKGSTEDINTNFFNLKIHPFTLNVYFCKFSNMNSATLERL